MTQLPFPKPAELIQDEKGRYREAWYRFLFNLHALVMRLANRPQLQAIGTVTVTGAATTGTATLGLAQPDASYSVFLTASTVSGAPAASSTVVRSISKTTTGFTVTVQAAPGGATSVTLNYAIMRV